ncbi:hypothetical protein [Mycobacterium malmoense]|uniref:hypothetical protein n=1 Tax=Mycobacterium malmoense TaxID=1780 RepID=UPI0008F930B4|nr:hypothetical protein [Mycobacterium malmoense]OIN80762.1 hypothetical protein BMG05_10475 [Mycobacterium malmoense]
MVEINLDAMFRQVVTGELPSELRVTKNLRTWIDMKISRGDPVDEFVKLCLGYFAYLETWLAALDRALDKDDNLRKAVQEMFPETPHHPG